MISSSSSGKIRWIQKKYNVYGNYRCECYAKVLSFHLVKMKEIAVLMLCWTKDPAVCWSLRRFVLALIILDEKGKQLRMESDQVYTFTNFSRGFIAIVKVYYFSIRNLSNAAETRAKARNLQAEALDKKEFLSNFVLMLKNHLINHEADDIYVSRANANKFSVIHFFIFILWNRHLGFCFTSMPKEIKRKYACHTYWNLDVCKRIDY